MTYAELDIASNFSFLRAASHAAAMKVCGKYAIAFYIGQSNVAWYKAAQEISPLLADLWEPPPGTRRSRSHPAAA